MVTRLTRFRFVAALLLIWLLLWPWVTAGGAAAAARGLLNNSIQGASAPRLWAAGTPPRSLFQHTPGGLEAVQPPARLAIYYGWPSQVNAANGDVARAAAAFGEFDVLVFGDGLEHPAHGDHAQTQQIIGRLAAAGVAVYGYVDMGVTSQNLSIATAEQYVDEWHAMGVSGIFWDDAGYDYGVSRTRLNTLVDYTHSLGLRAFLNAWNPADVFADDLQGPSHLAAGDWYLCESWLVGNGQYQDLASWAAKADQIAAYRMQTGVRMAAIGTGDTTGDLAAAEHPYQMAFWGAVMYNFDALGYTDPLYSASGPEANRLVALPLHADYGSTFLQTGVSHELNNTCHERATDLGRIVVAGDGATWGEGYFLPAGVTPTSTSVSATATRARTPTPRPTATFTMPAATATRARTPTPRPTATFTMPAATATPVPTETATDTPTRAPTGTPTPQPTAALAPTATATRTAAPGATVSPTAAARPTPAVTPAETPTPGPSAAASSSPTPLPPAGLAVRATWNTPQDRTTLVVGEMVRFDLFLDNTGGTAIIDLPLADVFDFRCLAYRTGSSQPAESSFSPDQGLIRWNDLIASAGAGLAPGGQLTVTIQFEVIGYCDAGFNAAVVSGALDEYGRPVPDPWSVLVFTSVAPSDLSDPVFPDSDADSYLPAILVR